MKHIKSDRVNLVAPASTVDFLLDAVQYKTGTGKVDPPRKLKCTTAARDFKLVEPSFI